MMQQQQSVFTLNQVGLVLLSFLSWSLDLPMIWIAWKLRSMLTSTLWVWLFRLMFFGVFVGFGTELFQPELRRLRPVQRQWIYATMFLTFLVGILVYYYIITDYFEGMVVLGEFEVISNQTGLGFGLYLPRYRFSWRNYTLYPFINLLGLLLGLILKRKRCNDLISGISP